MIMPYDSVEIRQSKGRGRGVFALKPIAEGTVIEVSPYILISPRDYRVLSDTVLINYVYDADNEEAALGLGYTSLYNHSDEPNATYSLNPVKQLITISAEADIARNEEITVDYGYHPAKPETWPEEYIEYMRRAARRSRSKRT